MKPILSGCRIALIGSNAGLSRQVLQSLVARNIRPVGVVDDQDPARFARGTIPVRVAGSPDSLEQIADRYAVPVVHAPNPAHPMLVETLGGLEADLLLAVCYPRRLPAAVLRVPKVAAVNLHPSLLPAFRGPQPLFWQARAGLSTVGVTWHGMDDGLDTGPIWTQASCPLPDGIDFSAANTRLGDLAAELLLAALAAHRDGLLPPRPQNPHHASYQGFPRAADFRLSTGWPARRAFNFVRMAGHWGRRFPVTVDGRTFAIAEALEFQPAAILDGPYRIDGERLALQFSPGVLHARMDH